MLQNRQPDLESAIAASNLLVEASQAADGRAAWGTKAFIGTNLFFWHLSAFDQATNPVPSFVHACNDATALLRATGRFAIPMESSLAAADPPSRDAGANELYGTVYARMADREYFDDSRAVFRARLTANDIDPDTLFQQRTVLDAGCGGGKFTQAIASCGAQHVIGVDIDQCNIDFARAQASKVPHGAHIEYRVGSVLALPVDDESVDFVWCNSVGHVTGNQNTCLAELARVLRPNGMLYYYVNGRFGLFEILLRTLYAFMKGVPRDFVHHHLKALGVGAGRISWVIACLFAPYEFLPRANVEAMLEQHGFHQLKRLKRGIDIDAVEKLARQEPFGDLKYGEGQLKYLATRI